MPLLISVMSRISLKFLSAVQHYGYRAVIVDFHLHILLKAAGCYLKPCGASFGDKALK